MPQPKKPPNLKAIAGTKRPDRDGILGGVAVDLPLVNEVPLPPDWLPNVHAMKEWERLAPILVANKLLTQAGLSALGILCSLHGKIVQLFAAGETPHASLVAQQRGLMNDFGLTPASQGKVKPGAETDPGNKFAKNGRRESA